MVCTGVVQYGEEDITMFVVICCFGSRNNKLLVYVLVSQKTVNLGQNHVGL